MLRKDIMSFEEMDRLKGNVNSDYENICYRIEDETNWLKEEEERPREQ